MLAFPSPCDDTTGDEQRASSFAFHRSIVVSRIVQVEPARPTLTIRACLPSSGSWISSCIQEYHYSWYLPFPVICTSPYMRRSVSIFVFSTCACITTTPLFLLSVRIRKKISSAFLLHGGYLRGHGCWVGASRPSWCVTLLSRAERQLPSSFLRCSSLSFVHDIYDYQSDVLM